MKADSLISIKTPEELGIMREAGSILTSIVSQIKRSLKFGRKTLDIDREAEKIISTAGVVPAFKGYRGFPGCVCLSVNEEVVHGVPGDRHLNEGDIVSLDVGIIHKGFYVDTAVTVAIGAISEQHRRLLDVTLASLYKGIEQARENNRLSDVSHAVQKYVEANQFSVVREFVGHGIGRRLHEDPEIPNFGPPNQGPVLKAGMVLAIEPMVNSGGAAVRVMEDGWTVVTRDKSPSAHFEHTVAIGKNGPEILTK